MSYLKAALALASRGFHVFPLVPNSKLPSIEDFPNLATRDPEQIKKWWVDPVMGFEQPYNVGISTSKFGDAEALLVVDVDNKGDKKGSDELLRLEMEEKILPKTATQTTPTGGQHLIYRVPEPVKQGVSVLGSGLDIRSKGGYIVGAGSSIDNQSYSIKDSKNIAQAPEWLIEACGRAGDKSLPAIPGNVIYLDQEKVAKRAQEYLEGLAPVSEGERNHAGYKVAAKLKDFGATPETAVHLMLEFWNCEPMLSLDEVEHVVKSAFKYGQETPGSLSPEAQFTKVEVDPIKEESYLEQINKDYALIFTDGVHTIVNETVDDKGRATRRWFSEAAFKRKFSPYVIYYGNGKKSTWAEQWLNWKGRREYRGICFAPEREAKHNYYNLWTGFTCKPVAPEKASPEGRKGVEMFLDHALKNVCKEDKDLFIWLMGYFAHLVQKPYERPLTTLVFRGSKGTGKNALVDRIGHLLGSTHYLVAHDSRYLTSNFNGHLDSCLMLVLDEAFWSGDKSAEGKLKGITTSPEIMIERKGKEPYTVDNLVRLIVIGNEDWLVPASHDERRYAVFDVGEGRKQDMVFFANMRRFIDDGDGKNVLLYYLKTFDLSKVDVNKAPMTAALREQKSSSLSPFQTFWFESLAEGKVLHADFEGGGWPTELSKEQFRNAFRRYWKERNIRSRVPDDRAIGRFLKQCAPSIDANQKARGNGKRSRVYLFPELGVLRQEWENFIGHKENWEF